MASVTAKEIPEEQAMFTQIWNVYKRYYTPEEWDLYWENLSNDLNAIINIYKSELCVKLCLAVEFELNRKYQQMKKEGYF